MLLEKLNVQEGFVELIDILHERFGLSNAILRYYDGELLRTKAAWGYGEEASVLDILPGSGVTGMAFAENQTIIINDLENYEGEYLPGIEGARSELCIPVCGERGIALGTLNVESRNKNNFTPEKVEILQKLTRGLRNLV